VSRLASAAVLRGGVAVQSYAQAGYPVTLKKPVSGANYADSLTWQASDSIMKTA
jgi:hypothetical protein